MALAVAGLSLLWMGAGGLLEASFEDRIASRPGLDASIDDASLCLSCGGYRVTGLSVEDTSGGARRPLFAVEELTVGLQGARLLEGRWLAAARLHEPVLHIDAGSRGGGSEAGGWSRVGSALFPAPIDRVDVVDGTAVLHRSGLEHPVRWRFTQVELRARRLASGGPGRLTVHGAAFDQGRFLAEIEVRPEAERFSLEARLRDVPLPGLNDYLASIAELRVEQGTLGADAHIQGSPSRWDGEVELRVSDLDVFEIGELASDHPARSLWEIAAASLASGLEASRQGEALSLRLEIDEAPAGDLVGPWQSVLHLVEASVLGLLRSPLAAVAAMAEAASAAADALR